MELDLEMEKKRKLEGLQVGSARKKPKVLDYRSMSQQDHNCCGKCCKMYEGACRAGSSGCFKCGQTGHVSRDCTATTITTTVSDLICCQYNQRGHMWSQYPSLAMTVRVVVPLLLH